MSRVYPARFAAPIDSALADSRVHVDGALMRGVIWKESHFDAGAISRSGAIGLTQLMPETAPTWRAGSATPPPADSALLAPLVNVRYGAHYLAASSPVSAGTCRARSRPTTPERRRCSLARRGTRSRGEAMHCELISVPRDADYVKGILGPQAVPRADSLRRLPRWRPRAPI